MTHTFVSLEGKRLPTAYPEGKDPLLAAWNRGECATHPRWTDDDYWVWVRREAALSEARMARGRARRSARKEEAPTTA